MSDRVFVYELFNSFGECLYVGATRRPGSRIDQHRDRQPWWDEVDESRTIIVPHDSAWAAREREKELILSRKPRHNRGGVTTGHIPFPAARPDGVLPGWVPRVRELMQERDEANAEYKASVLAVAEGASIRAVAAFTGLSTNTISRWKRETHA